MADQLGSGAVTGVSAEGGQLSQASVGADSGQLSQASAEWSPPEPFHGRPVSWVAVSLIMVAFLVGGLALIFGPTWWLFWAALGLAAVGGLLALATHIFDDWY
jgi:hypothetical protein